MLAQIRNWTGSRAPGNMARTRPSRISKDAPCARVAMQVSLGVSDCLSRLRANASPESRLRLSAWQGRASGSATTPRTNRWGRFGSTITTGSPCLNAPGVPSKQVDCPSVAATAKTVAPDRESSPGACGARSTSNISADTRGIVALVAQRRAQLRARDDGTPFIRNPERPAAAAQSWAALAAACALPRLGIPFTPRARLQAAPAPFGGHGRAPEVPL